MTQRSSISSAPRNNSHAVNARIHAIAARQKRFITTRQLRACGLSQSAINRRVASGWLFRVARGVYVVGMLPTTEREWWYANVLACPAGSVLGGLASIERRNFTRFRARRVRIDLPRQCRVQLDPKYDLVRSRALAEGHAGRFDGEPVASLEWAVLHLGRELDVPQICNVMHQARWRRWLDLTALEDLLERHPRIPGHRCVVEALRDLRDGSAGTRSFLEDRFRKILLRVLGYAPTVNIHIDAGRDSIEVDVPFLKLRIALEVDGPPHDEPNQQAKDRARDALLTGAGWTVHRFHWRDIDYRPWVVEQRLRAIFA